MEWRRYERSGDGGGGGDGTDDCVVAEPKSVQAVCIAGDQQADESVLPFDYPHKGTATTKHEKQK
jgi:hypothetical protein